MNIVTIKEVSEFIKVKESTLYSWVGCGLIPSLKVNGLVRFDMEQIEEWLANSQRKNENSKIFVKKISGNKSVDKIVKNAIANLKKKGV